MSGGTFRDFDLLSQAGGARRDFTEFAKRPQMALDCFPSVSMCPLQRLSPPLPVKTARAEFWGDHPGTCQSQLAAKRRGYVTSMGVTDATSASARAS